MNFETTIRVYEAMGKGDNHLRLQVIRSAINYSKIRVEWNFLDIKERLEMSARRTAAHNAFIDAINILSRSMSTGGQNTEWREILGENRLEIGDFACFLVAHLGILAR
jgi:hypothetical protein